MRLAIFNRDGPDLVVSDGSGVSVLLGRADGSFAPHVEYSTGQFAPVGLALGDFNGDGNATLSIFAKRPVAALHPSPLKFGSVKVGNTKTLNTKLYNSGGAPLKITAIKATTQYTQTNTCGSTLTVGSSCVVSVTFKPTGVGQHNGSLSIQDNAAAKPQVVVLRASGVK